MAELAMNDAPRMGDNIGAPYAEGVTDRLELDYGELLINTADALAEAETLPETVQSSTDVAVVAAVAVKLRDLAARADSHRKAEKEPWLRGGEKVDAFFFKRVKEPLDVRRKDLGTRLDVYKQRQLAEERARREAEAKEARRQQLEAQRQREEAEAAARRARSAETQEQRRLEAAAARVEADMAEARAEETTLATMAKAGRLVGERFEGDRSGQVTMRETPVVFIENLNEIDLEALRPYLKEQHVLMALRSWARATNYTQEMPGAVVGMRDATVIR